ncbi:hypothetical protein GCM10007878_26490 [Marinospirillum insulare]|uniref:Uncharacterized protein n=1 Tax=Marinospirillum insulare TaxID=217169 RepID=A0ABQ6A537_9GAMM|nr:hypothetical protein GCM10007878_26490 [Marinospirillum insulare]
MPRLFKKAPIPRCCECCKPNTQKTIAQPNKLPTFKALKNCWLLKLRRDLKQKKAKTKPAPRNRRAIKNKGLKPTNVSLEKIHPAAAIKVATTSHISALKCDVIMLTLKTHKINS